MLAKRNGRFAGDLITLVRGNVHRDKVSELWRQSYAEHFRQNGVRYIGMEDALCMLVMFVTCMFMDVCVGTGERDITRNSGEKKKKNFEASQGVTIPD